MLTRYRTPIIVIAIALIAVGAGLYVATNVVGGSDTPTKDWPPSVEFEKPFIVNLADEDQMRYIKLGVAVQLDRLPQEDLLLFTGEGGGGHGGGGGECPGCLKVAKDPGLRDAVIRTTSQFTAAELLSPGGKDQLEKAMLAEFEELAAGLGGDGHGSKSAEHHDPSKPPYIVRRVFFTEYAVQ